MTHLGGSVLVLGFALAAVGCAGSDAKGPSIDPGTGGSSGGGGTGGTPACHVEIRPVIPMSFDGIVAGAASRLRVRGEITGTPPARLEWSWSVTAANGTNVPVTEVGGDRALIEVPIAEPGSYTLAVIVARAPFCGGERTVLVQQPGARMASFRLRATPPPGSSVPAQELDIQVAGGTPSGGNRIALSAGTLVTFDPRHATSMEPIPAYVRITETSSRLVVEGHTRAGQLAVRLAPGTFDTLIVPDGEQAPVLLGARKPAELTATPLRIPDGIRVSGSVTDATAGPVPGARVVLRQGTLPSTLGQSTAAGTFNLRAAPGTFAAVVTRPTEAGTVELTIPADPGVAVPSGPSDPAPTLEVQFASFAPARLPLSLGAAADRVVVESMASVAGLATVKVGTATRAAALRLRGEFRPAADGTVSIAGLPRGRYKATVYPRDPAGSAAVTTVSDIDLSAGDAAPRTITLGPKVKLRGKLLPGDQAESVRIIAVDTSGDLPLAFDSRARAGGGWELDVNPLRTYTLRAQPGPGQLLARALFAPVTVNATEMQLEDRTLPKGLLYSGTVADPSLQPMGGTLLQIFCLETTLDCVDPGAPLAEAVTRSDGYFQLLLPDPGAD
jgi:hypothetical protein